MGVCVLWHFLHDALPLLHFLLKVVSHDYSNSSDFATRSTKRTHGSVRHGAMTMVKNGDQLDLGCHGGNARAIRAQHSANTQAKITKMLLLVSTVFVILNLPSYVSRLWVFIKVSA